jgi:predicted RNA binding protein YcfA (HicA-like mRNA interferase family)
MARQITRREVESWLVANGFERLPGKSTGHRHYSNGTVKVTVLGHGPQDLTKKMVGMLRRQLRQAGFTPTW